MKICTSCKQNLDISCFSKKEATESGLQYKCKECHKKYCHEHYLKHKEYYKKKSRRYNRDLRDEINNYKSSIGCARCSEIDYCCLDFHHVDEKIESIAVLVANSNRNQIYEEIKKCIVLCSIVQ